MTKNTPRIFISLLLMLLCIGILPVSAFASGGDYPDDALPATESIAADAQETKQIGTVTTNGGNLNVRTGAGLDNTAFTQLPNGTVVDVIGRDGDWVKILLPARVGYVYGSYLTVTDAADSTVSIGGITLPFDEKELADLWRLLVGSMTGGSDALTPDGNLIADRRYWLQHQGRKTVHYVGKQEWYHCRHSEADEESRCHKLRLNATELEQTVFLTLKKQMEATAPLAPDGTLRVDASVPERAEYEQQIETLQDGKRTLYERYLMGEIDLNTYKAEKATLLKTKNAYAAVLAQAKQKQDEQARQDSRKEASKAIFDADTLTTELLIDQVLVYPDKRIEIAYKIQDIFA